MSNDNLGLNAALLLNFSGEQPRDEIVGAGEWPLFAVDNPFHLWASAFRSNRRAQSR